MQSLSVTHFFQMLAMKFIGTLSTHDFNDSSWYRGNKAINGINSKISPLLKEILGIAISAS